MDRVLEKKTWTLRRIGMLSGAVCVAGLILYMIVFADSRLTMNIEQTGLTISSVRTEEFLEFIPVTGTIQPIRTIFLDAMESGRVEKIFVEAGTMVKEGQPILQLRNTNMILDAVNREAQLFEQVNNLQNSRVNSAQTRISMKNQLIDLQNQLRRAERTLSQNDKLIQNGHISQEEYKRAQDDYELIKQRYDLTLDAVRNDSTLRTAQIAQLERSADRLESNLKVVKQNLDNMAVKSPITGTLTALNAEIGEYKTTGTRLGQIDITDRYKVRIPVDEYYISRVDIGLRGRCELAGKNYTLTVSKIYTEVRNGRFEIEMLFDAEQPADIRRGQTLQIRLELGKAERVLLVDRGGFYQSTGGQWVFKLNPAGTEAYRVPVRLGRQNPQSLEVLDGLQAGDNIITSSYENFNTMQRLVLKK